MGFFFKYTIKTEKEEGLIRGPGPDSKHLSRGKLSNKHLTSYIFLTGNSVLC